ncbi:hypothetical protein JHK82_035305 [Glycine max]|nr:hypothetical protein JHK85_036030 [Glycine max]KAG5112036.1 hypothetical protein JHK82_035305 [Glycine max]
MKAPDFQFPQTCAAMCNKQHAPCYDICHGCYFQVIGTVVTVARAMLMTLYKGQVISFLGSKYMHHPTNYVPETTLILAVTLRKYPAQLSLTALVCALAVRDASYACDKGSLGGGFESLRVLLLGLAGLSSIGKSSIDGVDYNSDVLGGFLLWWRLSPTPLW